MEVASTMAIEKKLKPMVIPTLDGSPCVEGGYIPYSLTRADAYTNDVDAWRQKNIWTAMTKILPRVRRQSYMFSTIDPPLN